MSSLFDADDGGGLLGDVARSVFRTVAEVVPPFFAAARGVDDDAVALQFDVALDGAGGDLKADDIFIGVTGDVLSSRLSHSGALPRAPAQGASAKPNSSSIPSAATEMAVRFIFCSSKL